MTLPRRPVDASALWDAAHPRLHTCSSFPAASVLKTLRDEGLSLANIAALSGVSKTTLSKVPEKKFITQELSRKILDINLDDLVAGEEVPIGLARHVIAFIYEHGGTVQQVRSALGIRYKHPESHMHVRGKRGVVSNKSWAGLVILCTRVAPEEDLPKSVLATLY